VLVHAKAGKRLSRRIGTVGFLAREIPDQVPGILERLA
jgi:NAD(P)H-hydrate repair Nnr-like enzyme with NAD(P)H-hydrate dehydratase domain